MYLSARNCCVSISKGANPESGIGSGIYQDAMFVFFEPCLIIKRSLVPSKLQLSGMAFGGITQVDQGGIKVAPRRSRRRRYAGGLAAAGGLPREAAPRLEAVLNATEMWRTGSST